jgi:hypothetical protein
MEGRHLGPVLFVVALAFGLSIAFSVELAFGAGALAFGVQALPFAVGVCVVGTLHGELVDREFAQWRLGCGLYCWLDGGRRFREFRALFNRWVLGKVGRRFVRVEGGGAEAGAFRALKRGLDAFVFDRRGFGQALAFADPHLGAGGAWPAMAAAPALAVRLILVLAVGARLLFEQRLPVGDRDLVIVGVDFGESEEPVAVAAVVDEGCLQRRFDARDLRQIDVAAQRLLAC